MNAALWRGGFKAEGLTPLFVSIVGSASTHTKTAYTEIITSTLRPAAGFLLAGFGASAGGFLIDLAVGAAGSEKILLANLLHDLPVAPGPHMTPAFFPLAIPAGSRIAARIQQSVASINWQFWLMLISEGALHPYGYSKSETLGALTATTRGTAYDTGAVASTKNGWVEIAASTTIAARLIYLVLGNQNRTSLSATANNYLDIGVGAGGSEKIVVPDIIFRGEASSDRVRPSLFGPFPVDIASGSRIAINAQSSTTTDTTTSRDFDASIILVG